MSDTRAATGAGSSVTLWLDPADRDLLAALSAPSHGGASSAIEVEQTTPDAPSGTVISRFGVASLDRAVANVRRHDADVEAIDGGTVRVTATSGLRFELTKDGRRPVGAPANGELAMVDLWHPADADLHPLLAGLDVRETPSPGDTMGYRLLAGRSSPVAGALDMRRLSWVDRPVWVPWMQVEDLARATQLGVELGARAIFPPARGVLGPASVLRTDGGLVLGLCTSSSGQLVELLRRTAVS